MIHNYGHGGSGWSLSWGSGTIATEMAMATGEKDIAVIGCGALGLSAALLLQRAGATVTIYAKDLPPNVRSSLATGLWTPSSRICFEENATPAFKQQWERMCRITHATYQTLLGLPGDPIEWIDRYFISEARGQRRREQPADGRAAFAELERELVPDLRGIWAGQPPLRAALGLSQFDDHVQCQRLFHFPDLAVPRGRRQDRDL